MANEAILTVGAQLAGNTKQAFQTIASGMRVVAKAMATTAMEMRELGKSAKSTTFSKAAQDIDKFTDTLEEYIGTMKKSTVIREKAVASELKLSKTLSSRIAQLKSAMTVDQRARLEKSKTLDVIRSLKVQYHELFGSTTKYGKAANSLADLFKKTGSNMKGVQSAIGAMNREFNKSATQVTKHKADLLGLRQTYTQLLNSTDKYGNASRKIINAFTETKISAQQAGKSLSNIGALQRKQSVDTTKHAAAVQKLRKTYVDLISSNTKYGAIGRIVLSNFEKLSTKASITEGALKRLSITFKEISKRNANISLLATDFDKLATSTDQFGREAREVFAELKKGGLSVAEARTELKKLAAAQAEVGKGAATLQSLRVRYAELKNSTDRYGTAANKLFVNFQRGLISAKQLGDALSFLAKKQREAGAATKKSEAEYQRVQAAAARLETRYISLIRAGDKYAQMGKRVVASLREQKISAQQAAKALAIINQEQLRNVPPLAQAYQRLGRSFKTYMSYMAASSVIFGVIQGFRNMTKTVIDYDQALKDLQAITKATDEQVFLMGETIKQVASDTKFSAVETAEGMKLLGQSGLTAGEAIEAMANVADLATGTLTGMDTTVDLVTTSMRVFGIEAENTAVISDVFANAVNRSKLTIDKIRTSMNYIGPVAAAAGVDIKDTASAMMLLANQGIRASTIGTGLRQVFRRLVDPSKAMRQAMKENQLTIDDLNPALNKFGDVIENLRTVMGDDPQAAFQMFGQRGATAALALIKGNSEAFQEMRDIVEESGVAAEMAATQMEGLGVSFKNLQDKIKNLYIAMGDGGLAGALKAFVDVARVVVDFLTGFFSNSIVSTTTKWLLMAGAVHTFIAALTYLGKTAVAKSIFAPLIVGANGYTAAITTATGATRIFTKVAGAAMALLKRFWPVVLITGAIAVVQYFTRMNEEVDKSVKSLGQERGAIEQSVRSLDRFADKVDEFNGTAYEKKQLIDQIARAYPELAKGIREARGDLEKIAPLMRQHIDHLKELADAKLAQQTKGEFEQLLEAMEGRKEANDDVRDFGLIQRLLGGDIEELKIKAKEAQVEVDKALERVAKSFIRYKKSHPDANIYSFLGISETPGGRGLSGIAVKKLEEAIQLISDSDEQKIKGLQEQMRISREEAIEMLNREPAEIKAQYAENQAALEASLTAQHLAISVAEAKGEQTTLEANKNKLESTRQMYDAMLALAKDHQQKALISGDEELIKSANAKVVAAEQKVHQTRLRQLEDYTAKKKQQTEKLLEIDKKLEEKRTELRDKRVDAERDAAEDIANLQLSLEEKLYKIGQRGLTEKQKQMQDEERARQLLAESIKKAGEARRTNNAQMLEQANELAEKAGDYYGDLENSGKAAKGLKAVTAELIKNRELQKDMEVGEIDKELSGVEAKAKADIEKARKILDIKLEDFLNVEDMKMEKVKAIIEGRKIDEDTRHDKEMTNIQAETDAIVKKGQAAVTTAAQVAGTEGAPGGPAGPASSGGGVPNENKLVPSHIVNEQVKAEVARNVAEAIEKGTQIAIDNGAVVEPFTGDELPGAISEKVSQGVQSGIFDGVTVEGMPLKEWMEAGKKQGDAAGEAMAEEAALKLNGFMLKYNEDGVPIDVVIGEPPTDDMDAFIKSIQAALDREPGDVQIDTADAENMIQTFIRNANNKYRITIPVTTSGTQARAEGGPVYAMAGGGRLPGINSRKDKVDVKARPGEWFIRNESVSHWQKSVGDWFMGGVNRPNSRSGQALTNLLKAGVSTVGGGGSSHQGIAGMSSLGRVEISMGSQRAQVAATPVNARTLFDILKNMETLSS